jgi:hypothetical protein
LQRRGEIGEDLFLDVAEGVFALTLEELTDRAPDPVFDAVVAVDKAPPQLLPEPPAELWMLWNPPGDGDEGSWVPTIDDAPGGETFMTCLDRDSAQKAAAYQNDMYDLFCIPIRVK